MRTKFNYNYLLTFLFIIFSSSFTLGQGQVGNVLNTPPAFEEIILKVDTSVYTLKLNSLNTGGLQHIAFKYTHENPVVEVNLIPTGRKSFHSLVVYPSADFNLLDSLINMNNEYYKFKVRFNNISRTNFLTFTFSIKEQEKSFPFLREVRLFPVTHTNINFSSEIDELFIGEEKVFEVYTDNIKNLSITNKWNTQNGVDYKFSEVDNRLRLHIIPKTLGSKNLQFYLETLKPFLEGNNRPQYKTNEVNFEFLVKAGRLAFLNVDKKEITFEPGNYEPIEIQLDNNRMLNLQKTYRIENQEKPGGALIAELFTRSLLANDKVLCMLRVYGYHRKIDGYLYVKDGDQPKFITNFSITPKTQVNKVSILREGADWTERLTVKPGEKIEVRLEGQGMHKANFVFEGLYGVEQDTLIRSENLAIYRMKIPIDINKSKINIFNLGQSTGYSLNVREFQQPRIFDFVSISYGAGKKFVNEINKPVLYDKTIGEFLINFNPERIDSEKRLYGTQILDIEIKILGARNELIDIRNIENVTVCPAENSPRYSFYINPQCTKDAININNIINKKTYELDDWSKIQITFKHKKERYEGEGLTKTVEVILQKHMSFDIDVSFPAGLLTKTFKQGDPVDNRNTFSNLGGISLAMIAQFSFFKPNKIAQMQPYKIGAGFLALNTFNLNENARRDIGIVVLGSVYPTRRNSKLSFPLYAGGGYLLSNASWFVTFGPGIRFQL
jgi:hypothetical protein